MVEYSEILIIFFSMTEGIVMRFNFYIMFSLPLFHSKSPLTLTELDFSPIANTMVQVNEWR